MVLHEFILLDDIHHEQQPLSGDFMTRDKNQMELKI